MRQDLAQEVFGAVGLRTGEELLGRVLLDDGSVGHEQHRLAAVRANPISCVTTTIVMPSLASSTITSSTSLIISGSSADVGSSKSMTLGCIASARAIATRCCCPPESCAGYLAACSPTPTRSSSSLARLLASAVGCLQDLDGSERDVLQDGLVGEQVERLEDHADLGAQSGELLAFLGQEVAVDADLALVDRLEPVDRPTQRGLPGSRRADHDDDLAAVDVDVDVLEHVQVAEPLVDVAQGHQPVWKSWLDLRPVVRAGSAWRAVRRPCLTVSDEHPPCQAALRAAFLAQREDLVELGVLEVLGADDGYPVAVVLTDEDALGIQRTEVAGVRRDPVSALAAVSDRALHDAERLLVGVALPVVDHEVRVAGVIEELGRRDQPTGAAGLRRESEPSMSCSRCPFGCSVSTIVRV